MTRAADTAARVWYAATAVVIAVGLIIQLVLTFTGGADANSGASGTSIPLGVRLVRLFSFFTIDSNIIVLVVCVLALIRLDRDGRVWRVVYLDALLGIVITGIVFATVLAPIVHLTGAAEVATICFHYISPLLFPIGWLLLGPRRRFAWWVVLAAFIWPAVWLTYTFVRGAFVGWYPYPFLDVTTLGFWPALANALLVLVGAAVLALIVKAIDRFVPSMRSAARAAEASMTTPMPDHGDTARG